MSRLPDLSGLSQNPKSREKLTEKAENGLYCLDTVDSVTLCESSILLVRGALPLSINYTEELDAFMADDKRVPPTPNPFNRNTCILRKQATFGAAYNFGQKNTTIKYGEYWPEAVHRVLDMTKKLVEQQGGDPELYNGVHVNLYPHGGAGVAPHQDSERELLDGLPIFSFTLLSGD